MNTIWIYEICKSLKSGYIYFSCEIQTCLEFGLYAALLKYAPQWSIPVYCDSLLPLPLSFKKQKKAPTGEVKIIIR